MHDVTTTAFEQTDAGRTTIVMNFGGTPTTLVSRVVGLMLAPLMMGGVRRALQQDLADIKAACEAP